MRRQRISVLLRIFCDLVQSYDIWSRPGFVKVPKDQWMRIPLKEGAKIPRNQVYRLGPKEKKLVDETFDALHEEGKLKWASNYTPSGYPVFVVYRLGTLPDGTRGLKGRVVVDLRGLNKITELDSYPVLTQDEIIQLARGAKYMSVFDKAKSFYQWPVHPADTPKLSVISHRGQEVFQVTMMGFVNFPSYVQRQIDLILQGLRKFRAYIDDTSFAGVFSYATMLSSYSSLPRGENTQVASSY